MGWLMWNTMRFLAWAGLAVFATTLVLFIWFMFDVGFAWTAVVVIALLALLVVYAMKNWVRRS